MILDKSRHLFAPMHLRNQKQHFNPLNATWNINSDELSKEMDYL